MKALAGRAGSRLCRCYRSLRFAKTRPFLSLSAAVYLFSPVAASWSRCRFLPRAREKHVFALDQPLFLHRDCLFCCEFFWPLHSSLFYCRAFFFSCFQVALQLLNEGHPSPHIVFKLNHFPDRLHDGNLVTWWGIFTHEVPIGHWFVHKIIFF